MKQKNTSKGEILLYKTPEGNTQIDVKLEEETVWLTQKQLSQLFLTERSVITKHIGNIFKTKELERNSVCAKFAHTASDGKTYTSNFYNLDMIISVGYRVNSKRGTQFRIWANKVLKDYLVKGFALNEKKLKEQTERIKEIEKTLDIFSKVTESYQLKQDEFSGIIKVVRDYTLALDVLDKYDNQALKISNTNKESSFKITYEKAKKVIEKMKEKFGGSQLFGREKDKSFKGTIGAIYQLLIKKNCILVLKKRRLIFFILQ